MLDDHGYPLAYVMWLMFATKKKKFQAYRTVSLHNVLLDFELVAHWMLSEQDFHQAQPVEPECTVQMDDWSLFVGNRIGSFGDVFQTVEQPLTPGYLVGCFVNNNFFVLLKKINDSSVASTIP